MPLRILLVDDHQIMREGVALLLAKHPGLELVADEGCIRDAWASIEALNPDLVIADVELPKENGIDLAKRIHSEHPNIRVIMLTGHAELELVNAALIAGVSGYVLKLNASTELLNAIDAVASGKVYFSPEVSSILAREYRLQLKDDSPPPLLSPREREILKRMADGQTTKEIAFALRVSTKTVDTHRLNIMAKVGARSIAELTKYAIREGICSL